MSWHTISGGDVPKDLAINPDAAKVTDATNMSDASTVEDSNHEDINCGEQYTYLTHLNTENLMQFSQQSALNELMLKEIKPNLDLLPTFEEHDNGGHKFKLIVPISNKKSKSSWSYSPELNKIYIRMNEICSIDVAYTPKLPLQPLRVRVMLCFTKEISEPVLRCQNHISKENEPYANKLHSLLRCENPQAEYCGSPEGKSIIDRLSVLIPLGLTVLPKDTNSVKQTIALKFTCQNSCIGRRETSLIFILEGINGEILSQCVLDVKICSCPKRDKDADDVKNVVAPKRKMENDSYRRKAKRHKRSIAVRVSSLVKEDRSCSDVEDGSDDLNTNKEYNIQNTSDGGCRLIMQLPNTDAALNVIEYTSNLMAGKSARELNPTEAQSYKKYMTRLNRLHERGLKL